jgi:hypothetical protein
MDALLTFTAAKTTRVQRLRQTFPTSRHQLAGLIPRQTCSKRAAELPALVFPRQELSAVETLDVGSVRGAHFKAPFS